MNIQREIIVIDWVDKISSNGSILKLTLNSEQRKIIIATP